ncbi:MAG: two-component regulator propeller domain-containing protein [Bacteroidota bacterium]
MRSLFICLKSLRLKRLFVSTVCIAIFSTARGLPPKESPFSLDPQKAITQYMHRVWEKEQGLPQNSVNTILQSHDGYLWLGTQEGLVRFDGVKFTVFNKRNTPQLKNNYVWSLCEDSQHRLWIGTSGGGITCMDRESCTTFTTENGLAGNTVWCIREDHRKTLWVGTDGGLSRFDASGRSGFQTVPEFGDAVIKMLYEDDDLNLWVGTAAGVEQIRDGKVLPRRSFNGINPKDVSSLHHERSGRLWIGTDRGLRVAGVNPGIPGELGDVVIFCIRQDSVGTLWFATGGKGVWRFALGKWSKYTTAEGLSDNQVRSLFVDREGSVWIGTYGGGLNKLSESKFTTYSTKEGLSHDFVLSVCGATDGSLWVGTYGGGINRMSARSVGPLAFANNFKLGIVTSLCPGPGGTMWAGIHNVGLYQLSERGVVASYGSANGLNNPSFSALYTDRNGTLWIGSGEMLFRMRNGVVSKVTGAGAPQGGDITYIFEDSDASLWIGTQGAGLYKMKGGVFTHLSKDNGLSSNTVTTVYEGKDKTLWIGTDGGGLQRLQNGTFTAYTVKEGLFDDVVFTLLEDDSANFWMSSNNGIFKVSKKNLDEFDAGTVSSLTCQNYGASDGMKSTECNGRRQPSAWKDPHGRLWFATLRGVVSVDPNNLKLNTEPPPVSLERMIVNGSEQSLGQNTAVGPGVENVEFDYSALSLVAPERVRFNYMLEGFDRSWVNAGFRRTAYYTNLPPGTFRFHVIACNNDGVWNTTGASVSVKVLPFFYQTEWFNVLVLLAIGGAGIGLSSFRVHQMKLRERTLLALVDERTKGLFDEKKKVEVALQQAEQAKTEAEEERESAEEANKVKSQLLSLAAHDLKSPLISIKGFTQIIRDETERESSVGKMAEMIYGLSNNLLTLVNQLLSSAALESGTISLVKHRVDLCQLARSVVLNNVESARTKNQVLQLAEDHPEPCFVDVDEARLRDAMENLVTNAVKYSPGHTKITVQVQRDGGVVRFSIRDEGPGLTEDDKRRLFSRFQRLSARPTGGEHSTGLGLSLVKQIVELHQGRVFVDSEVGKGSTFTIELPLAGSGHQAS